MIGKNNYFLSYLVKNDLSVIFIEVLMLFSCLLFWRQKKPVRHCQEVSKICSEVFPAVQNVDDQQKYKKYKLEWFSLCSIIHTSNGFHDTWPFKLLYILVEKQVIILFFEIFFKILKLITLNILLFLIIINY